jgi:hypothetical protein
MNHDQRNRWLRAALICSLATPLLHVVTLVADGQNPVSTPISELSRGDFGLVQTLGLLLFGGAHIALAIALRGVDQGRLWPVARGLLLAAGIGQTYVAHYFLTASEATLYGPGANDPLWIIASLTGVAMGALQPGLARQARGLGLFSVFVLGAWLWLVPLILLVNDHWLGLYERIVGVVYVAWLSGVSYGLLRLERA